MESIVKFCDYQMSIPTHWLVFSLVVRSLSGRIVSYRECYKVAQQCGIDSEDELNEALWFLHTKMGLIRHFPVDNLSDIVIIDPQLLFDKVTELIVKTFTFEEAGMLLSKEFKDKGIFAYVDFMKISTIQNSLLTHSRFISLLKHLRILVSFNDCGKHKLFIPCVLAHADSAFHPPRQHSAVPTLAIVFDCGYCPKGVTGAVIKYLMTNEMESQFTWKLKPEKLFCDQVMFLLVLTYAYIQHILKLFTLPILRLPKKSAVFKTLLVKSVCQSRKPFIQYQET